MPYSVKKLSADVVEVAYDGVVSEADTTGATNECVRLQRQFSILRFLVVMADDVQVQMQPDHVREVAGTGYKRLELPRSTRIAVIEPNSGSARRFVEAYEQACRKGGWNVCVCPDRRRALEWLRESGKSPTGRG
jgi:hypothetical protein